MITRNPSLTDQVKAQITSEEIATARAALARAFVGSDRVGVTKRLALAPR